MIDGQLFNISDASVWMDHEFGSSQLSTEIGWDWFGIQFDNKEELMIYRITYEVKRDAAPYNYSVIYKANGETIKLKPDEIQLIKLSSWRSSTSGIRYPSSWGLIIPTYNYNLILKSTLKNQEIFSSIATYWEGSATVKGTIDNTPVTGNAYIELTNYR